jgi:type 2 lantibiotic biosynthesis protein LanM
MVDLPANFIEKTATLDEVLGLGFITVPVEGGGIGVSDSFWARWRQLASDGDDDRFERLIKWKDWNLEACLTRLRGFQRSPNRSPMAWEKRAQTILNLLVQGEILNSQTVEVDDARIPFFELISPIVKSADRELKGCLVSGGFSERHAEQLAGHVNEQLKQLLVGLLGPILFSLFRQHKGQATIGDTGYQFYQTFVERMRSRGFQQLFEARPVLLRLMATVHDQYMVSMQEFLFRLKKDLSTASEFLLSTSIRQCLDDVQNLEFGLSDPHNEGRSVIVVNFQCGERILYKPKDLRPEHHLSELLAYLKASDPRVELRLPKCLPMDGYGWMEFIECLPCSDQQQVDFFYKRAGAWLALIYLLNGSDIHEENLIACGEHPVPVDLEVLFQGGSVIGSAKNALHLAKEKVRHTVLGVGMLSTYGRDHNKKSFEIGGLKAGRYKEKNLVWTNVNTDLMNMEVKELDRLHVANLPRLGNVIQEAKNYNQHFIDGFELCVRLVFKLRDSGELMRILQGFKCINFRKVYRPTFFYYSMLDRLRHFKNWSNGLEWSLQAEFVFRSVDWQGESVHILTSNAVKEKAALLALNIPYFTQSADGFEKDKGDGSSGANGCDDGFSLTCSRLFDLSEKDVERELNLIHLTFGTKSTSKKISSNIHGATSVLDSPEKIASFIADQAIRHNGTAAWLGIDWHAELGKTGLVVLGQDVYNGNGGIAIFLAASAKLLVNHDLSRLAYEAVALMRESIADSNKKTFSASIGIGGGTGLTSYVYTLATLSQLLQNPALLNEAGHLIDQLDDHLIECDESYDVLSGSAGAILALLKCHRLNQSPRALKASIACGFHLLRHLDLWKESVVNPKADSTNQANGFAHGAAGISLALFRLSQVTGRNIFRYAALDLVEFENASFSAKSWNWPDLRHRHLPESTWACQWCHGATGIGLARLCALEAELSCKTSPRGANLLLQDVHRAVKGISLLELPAPLDSLCCGNAGNIEFLWEAGMRLNRPELINLADSIFAAVIDRHRIEGDFAWNSSNTAFNLGLFRGLSGLGYSMLRRANPGALPNVLIWE